MGGKTLSLAAMLLAPAIGFAQPSTPAAESSPSPTPAAVATPEIAEPPDTAPMIGGVEIHGFVSPGFLVTTHGTDYLGRTSDRGTFEFAEVGINFTKPLTERLRVGIQLFTRDLGGTGDYTQKADWFYLDYRWRDWLGFRAGRVKLPFGLYNDTSDVDSGRVPILLPQSVYPLTSRDYLLAQTGGEVYGFARLGPLGAVDYRAYYGTIFLDAESEPGSPIVTQEVSVPYIAGGRLMYESPIEGLRVGGSLESLRLDARLLATQPPPGTQVTVELPALLWVASAELVRNDLHLAAEYSRWHVSLKSSDPAVFPESESVSERGYVMASYPVASWLHPAVYYSVLYPDLEKRESPEDRQHDAALTLRFDVNASWLIKLEGHYMNGTAGLRPSLNPEPVGELPEQWGVFLVKTTASF